MFTASRSTTLCDFGVVDQLFDLPVLVDQNENFRNFEVSYRVELAESFILVGILVGFPPMVFPGEAEEKTEFHENARTEKNIIMGKLYFS